MRIIHFYPNRNHDGLVLREERFGEKAFDFMTKEIKIEWFKDQLDIKKNLEASHKNYSF